MEERIRALEETVELIRGICAGLLDRINAHEALQAQKETAIFDHIESVKKHV